MATGTFVRCRLVAVDSREIGNNGILLRIFEPDGGAAVGRLRIGKATLKSYRGRTSTNFKQVSMEKFIEWLDQQP